MQGQELDFDDPCGSFQLKIFYDSMKQTKNPTALIIHSSRMQKHIEKALTRTYSEEEMNDGAIRSDQCFYARDL